MDNMQLGVALLGICTVGNLIVSLWIVRVLRIHHECIDKLWRETWAARQ